MILGACAVTVIIFGQLSHSFYLFTYISMFCSEMSEPGADEICKKSRNVLLVGLSDDDEANRLYLQAVPTLQCFFHHHHHHHHLFENTGRYKRYK